MQNIADLNLTDAEVTQLAQAVRSIQTLLGDRLVALTPAQRRELSKMGDTSRSFCAQAVAALNTHADSIPRSFDLPALNQDWADYAKVETLVGQLRDLSERLDDTLMAIGSDIMTASNVGVGMLKAVNRTEPALDRLLTELSAARRRKPAPAPAPAKP